MIRTVAPVYHKIPIATFSLALLACGGRLHAADPVQTAQRAVPTKTSARSQPDAKPTSRPSPDETKTAGSAVQSPAVGTDPSTPQSPATSLYTLAPSLRAWVIRTSSRIRVTVEHSVTVVRHDLEPQADPDEGAQPNDPNVVDASEVVEPDEPMEVVEAIEPIEAIEVVNAEPREAQPATRQAPSGRVSRQVSTPRSWSIHGNPAWSYHPPSLRYQAKPTKRYQPHRDWTYHPAASRKYKSKRSRSYQRR